MIGKPSANQIAVATPAQVGQPRRARRRPPSADLVGPSHRTPGVGRVAALLLSPTLLVLGLVVGYPIIAALRLSFQVETESVDPNTGMVQRRSEPGLANFAGIFGAGRDRFVNALWNTTTFALATVTLEVVIGVAMALVMNRATRGRSLIRASILVPWAIPTAMSALLWRWVFETHGIVNDILSTHILWTTEGLHAWVAVVLADTWKTAPFIALLVLAGLQVIPDDIYEAARIDGSSSWTTFWRITLPMVKPALLVAVLFRILDVLRLFDLPYVLIGANKRSVETLSMLAWNEMDNDRFGPAAAYAVTLFVYIAVIAFVFVKLLGTDLVARTARRVK